MCKDNFMPCHASSMAAEEEALSNIALVGIVPIISMHRFNSLTCTETPVCLLIDNSLYPLSMF